MAVTRSLKDATLIKTKVMPAAAATNYTDSIDLGTTYPGATVEEHELEMAIGAMANNTDSSKTILFTLQDSADDSTFLDVSPLNQLQVDGVAVTGSVAVTKKIRLPSNVRRYIRVSQVVPSGAGDNTAVTQTYSLTS